MNIISNTVPTYVLNDLVWGFFPEKLCGETSNILDTPEKTYGDLINQTNPFFVRELPYSFDILIENFMDPAHIPFAHHGLQGVRTDGSPIPMEKVTFNNTTLEVSFNDTILNKSRQGVLSFNRPCGYHFKTKSLVTNKWKKNLQIYAVPVKNGRSRVLIQSPFKSKILPLLGDIVAKDKNAYEYLSESIDLFPSQEELSKNLIDLGFVKVDTINLFNGIVAIHTGYKI